ncbi:MAG TPA: CDGSH iron-sulfur domain-containing protein [Acidimicrobiia bacterium]|nr:CDGSH iron-sulfur domain-containing protein [Acidimicrobiia bacterium]
MARRDYDADGLTVHWDSARCVHTAICLNALPEVFDVQRRPWVDVTGAAAAQIADAVLRCPTGALRFTWADGTPEPAETPSVVFAVPNGPLVVRGEVALVDDSGATRRETRAAFCRCGRSGNQPFCDNSHRTGRFEPDPEATESPAEVCPPQDERFA